MYLTLQFYNQFKGKGTWKFNNSLLHDKEYVDEIKKCIKDTVNQYSLPGFEEDTQLSINPHVFWELLKCMIRGKTISYSSYIKKKKQEEETELENLLYSLQNKFNKNPSEEIKNEIQDIEEKLVICREKKIIGIMARAKAKWIAEGEKCTNYFCNLEKRQYNEKIIPKLINDRGDEIVDQFEILNEQKLFYEKLYTSSDPVIAQEHEDIFFDSKNPYINKLSDEQKLKIEGKLDKFECLNSLKNMKNGKSPGLDGFTTEFYKFFWIDLNEYLLNSYLITVLTKVFSQ